MSIEERLVEAFDGLMNSPAAANTYKAVSYTHLLGTIKQYATLAAFVERAKKNPEDLPGVLCKDFNVPETSASVWLSFEDIKNDETFTMQDVYNTYAIGGCDLSATTDLTCATLLVRRSREDDTVYVLQHYFIPQKRIDLSLIHI